MPELPEVETVKRGLENKIIGKKVIAIRVLYPKLLKNVTPQRIKRGLTGKKIAAIKRRGKYIIILFNGMGLIIHLKMTGQLIYSEAGGVIDKHTHLFIDFKDGSKLFFRDVRKFGEIHLLKKDKLKEVPPLSKLGPEPLEDDFTYSVFKKLISNKSKKIKSLLLEQSSIVGIGNIYADELLFQARIDPQRKTSSLKEEEIRRLYRSIRATLRRAIKHKGTTLRDATYVDSERREGSFQRLLKVHVKEGEKCKICQSIIRRIKMGGRSTYFCPRCQR